MSDSYKLRYEHALGRMANLFSAMDKEIKEQAAELAELREAQRWIPVRESLPPDSPRTIQVADKKGNRAAGCADFYRRHSDTFDYWAELPPPPTEQPTSEQGEQ